MEWAGGGSRCSLWVVPGPLWPRAGPLSDATGQVSDDARFHQLPQELFLSLDVVCPGLQGKTETRSVGQPRWLPGHSPAKMHPQGSASSLTPPSDAPCHSSSSSLPRTMPLNFLVEDVGDTGFPALFPRTSTLLIQQHVWAPGPGHPEDRQCESLRSCPGLGGGPC